MTWSSMVQRTRLCDGFVWTRNHDLKKKNNNLHEEREDIQFAEKGEGEGEDQHGNGDWLAEGLGR